MCVTLVCCCSDVKRINNNPYCNGFFLRLPHTVSLHVFPRLFYVLVALLTYWALAAVLVFCRFFELGAALLPVYLGFLEF